MWALLKQHHLLIFAFSQLSHTRSRHADDQVFNLLSRIAYIQGELRAKSGRSQLHSAAEMLARTRKDTNLAQFYKLHNHSSASGAGRRFCGPHERIFTNFSISSFQWKNICNPAACFRASSRYFTNFQCQAICKFVLIPSLLQIERKSKPKKSNFSKYSITALNILNLAVVFLSEF